jgi:Domain of unknown function (DUF4872)/Butirosin biosynthesis protein H, N-terminal
LNKIIADYPHRAGRHCGTTSVTGMLQFHGHEMSEPMCLGLAAGLDFVYVHSPNLNPSHFWGGRHAFLEAECFERLGVACAVRQTDDNAEAWGWVKERIDAGRPAMLQADIRWLEYYRTKTHFGGHKIVVVGYDDEAGTALIGDSEFPELQTVPLAGLAQARSHTAPPWTLRNDWFDLTPPKVLRPLETTVPEAIASLAQRMTSDRGEQFGVEGMLAAANELPRWGEAEDWSWCARFGYQILEKRGTGGGNFRAMYADFLREAAPYCARIDELKLAEQMTAIAAEWTELAYLLREISDRTTPQDFDRAGNLMRRVAARESAYYEAALGCASEVV